MTDDRSERASEGYPEHAVAYQGITVTDPPEITVKDLLIRAKHSIASGLTFWQAATEDMAAAQRQGASQRQIAKAVDKAGGWVNTMLQWRRRGYEGTPFGPQSKASRERASVQSPEQQRKRKDCGPNTEQDAAATGRMKTAKSEAAKAKADAAKAIADALRAKAEAATARAEADKAEAEARTARARANNPDKQQIHSEPRDLLVKALGMLGSDHAGERAAAALVAEKQRVKLGMSWGELIVSAHQPKARAA